MCRRLVLALTKLLAASLLALPALVAAEGVYTWKDADGRTHFGDQPPASADSGAEEVDIVSRPPGTDQNVLDVQKRTRRLFDAQQESRAAEQEKQGAQKAAMEKQCEEARRKERVFAGRVYFTAEDGKDYTVSENERRRMLQDVQAWISENCR